MVTIAVDLLADQFNGDLFDGQDATAILRPIQGIKPDKLVVKYASGVGGGNPDCLATFKDERAARVWFSLVEDDDSPEWFDENVVT